MLYRSYLTLGLLLLVSLTVVRAEEIISPDGKLTAKLVDANSAISIQDNQTQKIIGQTGTFGFIPTNYGRHGLTKFAFSPNSKYLLTATGWTGDTFKQDLSISNDLEAMDLGRIQIWDAHSGQLRRTIVNGGDWYQLVFSPDSVLLISSTQSNETDKHLAWQKVFVWELEPKEAWKPLTKEAKYTFFYASYLVKFIFSPDNRLLFAGGGQARPELRNAQTGKHIRFMEGSCYDCDYHFQSDGRTIQGNKDKNGDGKIDEEIVWDTWTGKQIKKPTNENG